MSDSNNLKENKVQTEEIIAKSINGIAVLIINILLMLASAVMFVKGIILADSGLRLDVIQGIITIIISLLYLFLIGPILFAGLKILKPNEALVLTLFGKYYGTLKGEGFFFVNPFVSAAAPNNQAASTAVFSKEGTAHDKAASEKFTYTRVNKKISLKTMTLNNDKQKINDELGNPIIIGIVVIWRIVDTAKAIFDVDNYTEFLSIQCDSALRNIVRLYPYDSFGNDNEKTLRGSSQEVALRLQEEIQAKVDIAGLEIIEARITNLSYAPEIAAAMLQRQQASAIIDARQMIVEGAVGMVEMALSKLNENDIVKLDEERKAAMVSNLLVVLCGNKDAQPIVNSGSLY